MCGRAAQTYYSVAEASKALGVTPPAPPPPPEDKSASDNNNKNNHESSSSSSRTSFPWRDNYNLSPGMDAYVIRRQTTTADATSSSSFLSCDRMVWGLVTQGGTSRKPLPARHNPQRMALHFNNNMFNARTDTLLTKPTFCRLLSTSNNNHNNNNNNNINQASSLPQTCLVMLRGYFEWKTELKQKQPYFVYAANHPYVLIAGLWNTVATGLTNDEGEDDDDATLSTFCVLTTDATPSIQWLHHRMPLCVWDYGLAQQWLHVGEKNAPLPLPALLDQLEQSNVRASDRGELKFHAVTREMTSLQFRDERAIQAIPKPKTVASFFAAKKASITTKPTPKTPPKAAPKVVAASMAIKQEDNWKQPSAATAIKQELVWNTPDPNADTEKAPFNTPDSVKSHPNTSTSNRAAKPDTPVSNGRSSSPQRHPAKLKSDTSSVTPNVVSSYLSGWDDAGASDDATPAKSSSKPKSIVNSKSPAKNSNSSPKKKQSTKPSPAKKKAATPTKKRANAKGTSPTKRKGTPTKPSGSSKTAAKQSGNTPTLKKSPLAKATTTPDQASSSSVRNTPTKQTPTKPSPAKKAKSPPKTKTVSTTTTTKITPAKTTKVTTTKTIVNHGSAKTTKVTTTTTTIATKSPYKRKASSNTKTPNRAGKKAKTDPNSLPITSFFSPKAK